MVATRHILLSAHLLGINMTKCQCTNQLSGNGIQVSKEVLHYITYSVSTLWWCARWIILCMLYREPCVSGYCISIPLISSLPKSARSLSTTSVSISSPLALVSTTLIVWGWHRESIKNFLRLFNLQRFWLHKIVCFRKYISFHHIAMTLRLSKLIIQYYRHVTSKCVSQTLRLFTHLEQKRTALQYISSFYQWLAQDYIFVYKSAIRLGVINTTTHTAMKLVLINNPNVNN